MIAVTTPSLSSGRTGSQRMHGVGEQRQCRAAKTADEQQASGPVRDQRPDEMRHHETDERDRAGHRDGAADGERGTGNQHQAQAGLD